MGHAPNFLTCPAVPELPPPEKEDVASAPTSSDSAEEKPFIALQPDDRAEPDTISALETVQTKYQPKTKKSPRKRGYVFGGIVVGLLLIGILTIPPGIAMARAFFAAQEAKQHVDSMRASVEEGDFEQADESAEEAVKAFEAVQAALQGVGFWRDLPYFGEQIRTVQDVSVVSAQSIDGVSDLLKVAQSIVDAMNLAVSASSQSEVAIDPDQRISDLTPAEKRAALAELYRSLPDIRMARDKIDIAMTMWQSIDKDQMIPYLREALQPMTTILPVMQQSLDQAIPLIEVFVPLAGYPNPQEYVIVTQNADEIRPAGGFIGSVIAASVDSGEVLDYQFSDVYNIDNPASGNWHEVPPEPISKHLGVTAWYMRDANWSPDFPTSAERVLDFYEREIAQGTGQSPPRPTGFVALEPGFFSALIKFTGPVTARGKEFNAENFMDVLQYEVEMAPGITPEDRKDLMGEVGDALFARIQEMPRSLWPRMLDIVTKALDRKQIMVYSRDPSFQLVLDQYAWSGRALSTSDDFVWVIDANLAALKTDRVMQKSIDYSVDARDINNVTATVTLRYTNTATQSTWRNTRYRSYTRVYVPEGAELIRSSGAMENDLYQTGGRLVPGTVDVMKELGKTVFGAFWSIELGKTGELSFTYRLPAEAVSSLADGQYHLTWPKQAGADSSEFNVSVQLPRTVQTAVPAEPSEKWGDALYEVQVDSLEDREFEVKF